MRRWFTTGLLMAMTAALLFGLASCGGGGDSSRVEKPANDWDVMTWDTGTWQ